MNCLPLRLLGCLFVLLMLAGCVSPSSWPPVRHSEAPATVSRDRDRDLVALLAYYQELAGKPETALQQERKFYQAALIEDRCSLARMRLGLVLLRTSELDGQIEGSEQVMPPCLPDSGDGRGTHLLALLIHQQLGNYSTNRTHRQDALQTLETLKKDNQELRRQVDGLKAIERSLQNRRHRE